MRSEKFSGGRGVVIRFIFFILAITIIGIFEIGFISAPPQCADGTFTVMVNPQSASSTTFSIVPSTATITWSAGFCQYVYLCYWKVAGCVAVASSGTDSKSVYVTESYSLSGTGYISGDNLAITRGVTYLPQVLCGDGSTQDRRK